MSSAGFARFPSPRASGFWAYAPRATLLSSAGKPSLWAGVRCLGLVGAEGMFSSCPPEHLGTGYPASVSAADLPCTKRSDNLTSRQVVLLLGNRFSFPFLLGAVTWNMYIAGLCHSGMEPRFTETRCITCHRAAFLLLLFAFRRFKTQSFESNTEMCRHLISQSNWGDFLIAVCHCCLFHSSLLLTETKGSTIVSSSMFEKAYLIVNGIYFWLHPVSWFFPSSNKEF